MAQMKAVVSEKGQVTIPKALRESLGIRPGTELAFEEQEGHLVARRLIPASPIRRLVGVLPRLDVDKRLSEMRGPGYDPEADGR
jgi:AbrB family looped-hinge helix DNA binding protein